MVGDALRARINRATAVLDDLVDGRPLPLEEYDSGCGRAATGDR